MRLSLQAGSRESGSGRGAKLAVAFSMALAVLSVAAPSAYAGADEIMIREIYSGGSANDSYVMLQASGPGQNQVTGFTLRAYSPAGSVIGTKTFQSDVANSAGQMTLLIADSAYKTGFPTGADPDLTMPNLDLQPSAGAVCWEIYDCVSWGNFTGATPSPAGQPAFAVGGGQRAVLSRYIGNGCSSALDADDDTDQSVDDFSTVIPPHPRDNASPILETECDAPSAVIDSTPPKETTAISADFTFHSIPGGKDLECRQRGERFEPCDSGGFSFSTLAEGIHQFQVRAREGTNPAGNPASYSWEVDLTPPTATVDVPKPPNPTPGPSATFYFSANEEATFECSLTEVGQPDDYEVCSTQRTFPGLADGDYRFKVRGTDTVGQVGPPASYDFTVDSTLEDNIPPETTITSHPPDPSAEKSASFTYRSSEPRSTFQCKFDSGPFEFCWPDGIAFEHLDAGLHTFEVRARDEKDNVDPTPATYTFSSVLTPLVIELMPAGQSVPDTGLTSKPRAKSRNRMPTIRFSSSAPGATFQCQLDSRAFRACSSPLTTKSLSYGKHTFRVIAQLAGIPDPTPAGCSFEVVKAKPKHRRRSGG